MIAIDVSQLPSPKALVRGIHFPTPALIRSGLLQLIELQLVTLLAANEPVADVGWRLSAVRIGTATATATDMLTALGR